MNAITQTLFILIISTLLVACGGGGSDDPTPTPSDGQAAAPPADDQTDGNDTPPSSSSKTVKLSWSIPSQRTNGDPLQLSEISGYEIYYFLEGAPSSEEEMVSINDPSITDFTTALDSGTYHFAIATIDSSGVYSDSSDFSTAIIP